MGLQDAKALFHSKTLNNALRSFRPPTDLSDKHQVIQGWIKTLESRALDSIKEVSLHGDFLKDVFQTVLGYRSVIQGSGQNWEIIAEKTIKGRGSADAALGFFTSTEERVIAPIELKGAMTDLDRGKSRNQLSPVDQGWSYADYVSGCQWVIVSNYRETRLYNRHETKAYYERFLLEELHDLAAFKRFYYLLCRQNFLPAQNAPDATSVIDILLKDSKDAQEEITDRLYSEYSEIRQLLVNDFIRNQQTAPQQELLMIEKAQKLLDRVLFVAFCEDRGLLPSQTLKQAYEAQNAFNPQPIWNNFTTLFKWIDRGNHDRHPPIPGYNGGLFAHDPILDDQITVPDPRCEKLKNLTRFDFDTEVSVDILGHIFEQSITDLEKLRAEKTGQTYSKQDEKKGKRKTHGIYYTPAWVTQYIVEAALGGYLKRQEQIIHNQLANQIEQSADADDVDTATTLTAEFWQAYQQVLNTVRVIDPACGSGAFLIAAFDYLLQEHERVNRHLELLGIATQNLADVDRTILTQNLFGVDLSPESVEITKLSLWLKTAVAGKTLTDLDQTIKVGNSIVDAATVTERAFDWFAAFPTVFVAGGFDVVIGNPPYVRQEFLSPIKPYLQQHYQSYDGVADLYTYFYEKGMTLLKSDGVLSYIVTNKWLRSGYGEALRRFFTETSVFEQIIDFGHAPIFQDADTFPCIVVTRKVNPLPPSPQPVVQASSLPQEDDRLPQEDDRLPQEDDRLPQEVDRRQDACPTKEDCTTGKRIKKSKLRISRRRLPHWELDGSVYFVTFNTWEKLELNEAARKLVVDACRFFDRQRYETLALVVMPDHVHWLLQPLPKIGQEYWSLRSIMHSIKSYSAKQIPQVMRHIGTVWQIEWYDRIIRDEQELRNTWEYIRQNPVEAGLSATPEAYPFLWQCHHADRPVPNSPPVAQASSLPPQLPPQQNEIDIQPGKQDTQFSRQDACPTVIICPVPREKLSDLNLSQYVQQSGYTVPWTRFTADAWSLEPPAVDELMGKIKRVGVPLKDFAGVKPLYGIKTGFNEAFLIDDETKNRIVQEDPKSVEVIKPYLRGQDVDRWIPNWQNLWMIFVRHGVDIDSYPAIKQHLSFYRESLEPRPKDWNSKQMGEWKGRKPGKYNWYEIQDNIAYWQMFERPKIVYQEIQFHPTYCYEDSSCFANNKAYILPTADLYILGTLNSPLIWWYNWRYLPHMKDDALTPKGELMETLPIAPPTDDIRSQVEPKVNRLIELTKANQEGYRDVLDWMRSRFRIEKLGQKLESFANLSQNEFVDEVRNRIPKAGRRGSDPLGVAGQRDVKTIYNEHALVIQTRNREILKLEHELSDLVNQAYGLTPEEIDLMWKTAPPRMPIDRR